MPALFGGADYYGPTFQAGLGFTGIAVALLGRNRPLGIFFGARALRLPQRAVQPASARDRHLPDVVQITQGVIVLAVVIAYEVVRRSGRRGAARGRRELAATRRPTERRG